MEWIRCLLLVSLLAFARSQVLEKCRSDAYPPKDAHRRKIPTEIVQLDIPPKHRWAHIVLPRKTSIKKFINYVKHVIPTFIANVIFPILGNAIHKVPYPYNEEIIGIAEALDMSVGEILAGNIFYELDKFCTSIVMQDERGHVYHGRNLDLGAWMGWDSKNRTWVIEELLHPMTMNVEYQMGGETMYKAVQFAGTVGVFTGVSPGKFSFSLNSRSGSGLLSGPRSTISWLLFANSGKHFASLLGRSIMERARSYEEAFRMLSETELLVPVYYIIAGSEPNQGAVITRSTKKSEKPRHMSWDKQFVLQTNYDHWKSPPFYDDRRKPARKCIRSLRDRYAGDQTNVPEILYNVLSTIPVKNKATVYTSIMSARTGLMESYLQNCPGFCYPW